MSKITESARGEMCTIRIVGVCNHNRETSVWCHGAGSATGKGIGMKCIDLLGAIGCSDCHDVVDGRRPPPSGMTRDDVRLDFWEGHARSVVLLFEKGLLVLDRGTVKAAA